ncbi:MAG: hypothetical protein MZU79_06475 [Anaerotruncus sp.]|nr:hypothetical protein [Anaerotruncus sp.]
MMDEARRRLPGRAALRGHGGRVRSTGGPPMNPHRERGVGTLAAIAAIAGGLFLLVLVAVFA